MPDVVLGAAIGWVGAGTSALVAKRGELERRRRAKEDRLEELRREQYALTAMAYERLAWLDSSDASAVRAATEEARAAWAALRLLVDDRGVIDALDTFSRAARNRAVDASALANKDFVLARREFMQAARADLGRGRLDLSSKPHVDPFAFDSGTAAAAAAAEEVHSDLQ